VSRRCKQCKTVELKPAAKCTDIVEKKGFCSIGCLAAMAREKNKAKACRTIKEKHKQDKLAIETLRQACGKAQIDFNKLICTYDRLFYGKCISGGGPVQEAGHLVHRGSKYGTSWLTFFHANLHGQSTHDNCFKGGEEYNYRRGLIKRHGKHWLFQVEKMKRLEDCGELPKPTKDEVRAMASWCRAMTRLYEKMI